IPIRNVAMSKTMVATAISIAIIFVATMIIVALFYRIPPKEAESLAPHAAADLIDSGEIRIVARPAPTRAEE
ncbi:MAG: hypothetical protein KY455_12460, partial [Euryarchaeota archaeon]|nr:hypothetical protein [Euryarchaeota archaeon]